MPKITNFHTKLREVTSHVVGVVDLSKFGGT